MVDTELSEESSQSLVRKPRAVSVVWDYFGLKTNENGTVIVTEEQKPVCRTCHRSVPAKGGNTSNLMAHLKEHHPELYTEAMSSQKSSRDGIIGTKKNAKAKPAEASGTLKQPTIIDVVEISKKYNSNSPQALELNRAVAYFIAKDAQPFYIVERPGFRAMIAKLNPRYELPGRKYFVEHQLPQLYNEVKTKIVIPKLEEAAHLSVTTDMWTSNSNTPFMSFTVHFIDSAWHLQSLCLDTVPLFSDHTGQNIAEAFQDVLANWNISMSRVTASTTDNGSNFVAAFGSMECEWLSCFGHNLNLAVSKAVQIDRVQRCIRKCHSLIEVFSRSWKKNRDLRQKQEALGLPKHKLIADVSTRWGSTFEMVSRIIEQQQAVCAVLADDRKCWSKMPSEDEFTTLEDMVKVLEPLSYFTDALSGEQHVTVSAVRPLLNHIIKHILLVKPEDRPIVSQMKAKISEDLQQRYNSLTVTLLDKCSFLDPRFRGKYVMDKDEVIYQLKQEAVAVLESENEKATTDHSAENPEESQHLKKKRKGLSAILYHCLGASNDNENLSHEEKIDKEIKRYEEYPPVDVDLDPLMWWKDEQKKFPVLESLARKYLCICGTSVPSERLFSQGGNIVNTLRNRLSAEHVNMLIFLAKNLP